MEQNDNEIDIIKFPTHKLKKPQPNTRTAILFYNGTFCPIHNGHLDVLFTGLKYVNHHFPSYHVIGAYLSPCHAVLAKDKLQEQWISTRHRLNLCHLAIEDLDWVMIDTFECHKGHFLPIHEVLNTFTKRVVNHCPWLVEGEFDVIWLGGIDGFSFYPTSLWPSWLHLVVVSNRHGGSKGEETREILKQSISEGNGPFKDNIHLVETEFLEVSSTQIRNTIYHNKELGAPAKVLQYIQKHHLWKPLNDVVLRDLITPGNQKITNFSPDTITPDFFTKVLREEIGSDVQVTSITFKLFSRAFTSTLYQITLNYDKTCSTYPTSVIVKVPNGKIGPMFVQYWISEVNFYKFLAPQIICVKIPKCYYAFYDEETKFGMIILEEIQNSHQFSITKGIPEKELFPLVESLAEFHAQFWKSPGKPSYLDNVNWLKPINHSLWKQFCCDIYKTTWKSNNHYIKKYIPGHALEYIQNLDLHLPNIMDSLAQEPYTLCHGDMWTSNILFDPNPVFIDWQWIFLGNGLMDLAFLLHNSVDTQLRQDLEQKLLKQYYKVLCRNGVSRYTFKQCLADFKKSQTWSFVFNFRTISIECPKDRVIGNLTEIIPLPIHSHSSLLPWIVIGLMTVTIGIVLASRLF